jgi:uncharacterized protein
MNFSSTSNRFRKVFDRSDFLISDPIVKATLSPRGSNLIFGAGIYDPEKSQLIYLGQVSENSAGKSLLSYDCWLDIGFPHVIYITGTRGSGKSFDLGVLLEGISCLTSESNVRGELNPVCSILVDTQSQFWTLRYPPNEEIPEHKEQIKTLNKWGIDPNSLSNCRLWRVTDEDVVTGDESILRIRPSLVKHEEWCEILGLEVYGPQGYAIGMAIENQPADNYSIRELIDYIHDPNNLLQLQQNSKDSLIYKLDEYDRSGLFDPDGIEISDFLKAGQCNILLLRGLRDVDKSLVVCVLARQLFTEMGRHHKKKKVDTFFNKDSAEAVLPDRVWLMIDEAHVIAPSNQASPAREALVEYVKRGRDAGLSLVLATQQPSAIDDRILSQVNLSFSHRLSFQSDISAAMARIPTKLIKKMKIAGVELSDFGDMIRYLGVGECFIGDSFTSRTVLVQIRPRMTAHGGYAPI